MAVFAWRACEVVVTYKKLLFVAMPRFTIITSRSLDPTLTIQHVCVCVASANDYEVHSALTIPLFF